MLLHHYHACVGLLEHLLEFLISSLDGVVASGFRQLLFELLVASLDVTLLLFKGLNLLTLAFSRRLCGPAIAKHALYAALLLFILRLGSLSSMRVSRHIYNCKLLV